MDLSTYRIKRKRRERVCEEVGICRVQDCSELGEDTSGHMDRTKLVRT